MAHPLRHSLRSREAIVKRQPPREDLAFFLMSFTTGFIILYSFVI